VTVAGGKLAAVALPAGKGDLAMDDAAISQWIDTLVSAKNFLKVDAISGATTSCDLLRYAVLAALQKAAAP
jgi:major membrane immunogen (membrane-anchored lipoprotein)